MTAGVTGTFNPDANTPGATFTHASGGAGGNITLRWTVTNPTCGQSATADVIVTVKQQPTATVGGPQTICALGTTAGLGGNTPAGGATGLWTIVTAGATGTFNPSATTPNATFTHTAGTGAITLRWTVSNAPCTDAFADVIVTISQQPVATAGGPQTICALGTTMGLGGNTPTSGDWHVDDSDCRSYGHVQPEREYSECDVHSYGGDRPDNFEMDGFKSALSGRNSGCGYHNRSAADNGDGWAEPDNRSPGDDCWVGRQHSNFGNRLVVDSYCRSDGNLQPECYDAERYVDALDRQRSGGAQMDYLESPVPGFIR